VAGPSWPGRPPQTPAPFPPPRLPGPAGGHPPPPPGLLDHIHVILDADEVGHHERWRKDWERVRHLWEDAE